MAFGYRREDETSHRATFDAVNGVLKLQGEDTTRRSSRRHWVGLVIDCESCRGGMLVFAQHKGNTEVIKVPNPRDDRRLSQPCRAANG